MAERHSEYARIEGDDYATPSWVTEALLSVEDMPQGIWECAPGDGVMVRTLRSNGAQVYARDQDFLTASLPVGVGSILTNPPYKLADAFVDHALLFNVKVAMLLPIGWDTAKSRARFFRDCKAFKAKHILTRRIRWANIEQKSAGPSMNHAWYVWGPRRVGVPTIGWLPLKG